MELPLKSSRANPFRYSVYCRFALAILLIGCGVDLLAGSLPWDGTADTIRKSLTGPVAWAVALIALFATGATYIFGKTDLSDIALLVIKIVFFMAFIFAGGLIINALYTVKEDDIKAALLPITLYQ